MKKQFFWLKIQKKFFLNLKMKKLLTMENGAEKLFIYIQMMLLALENDGAMIFQHVEDTFEEEVSLQLNEDENLVKETLEYLIKQNLVEVNGEEYVFLQLEELTGNGQGESTNRVRRHRASKNTSEGNCNEKESESGEDVTPCNAKENKCNGDVTLCNADVTQNVATEKEIDKEKDLEKEIDKDLDTDTAKASVTCLNTNLKKTYDKNLKIISQLFEKNMGPIYPNISIWLLDTAQKFEVGLFEKAIEICGEKNQMNVGYLRGIFRCWENEKIFKLKDLQQNQSAYFEKTVCDSNEVICEEEEIDEEMLREIKALQEKLDAV